MKLLQLIKRLENTVKDIKANGGDVEASEVAIEAVEDTGDIYYENSFDIFVDDNNDIGLSPVNK